MKQEKYKEIIDLALATTLVLRGFPIDCIDRNTYRNKVVFIFKQSEELEAEVVRYFRDETRVSPYLFFNALKSLKTQIHQK